MGNDDWLQKELARPFRTVAFLQNQWLENPEAWADMLRRSPERRERYIAKALFMRCLTGRRIRAAFGDYINEIIWEETTREVGSVASSKPKPDLEHIQTVLAKFKPHLIITFGQQATKSIDKVFEITGESIWRPFVDLHLATRHPAARPFDASELREVRETWFQHREEKTDAKN